MSANTTLLQNTTVTGAKVANTLLTVIQPVIAQINVIMNQSGGLQSTVVQGDLDAISSLQGITLTQWQNAMGGLTGTLLTDLNAVISALSVLAARYPGQTLS